MGTLDKLMDKIQLDYVSDEPVVKESIRKFIKALIPAKKTGFREMSLQKWNHAKGFNEAVEIMLERYKKL